MYCLKIDRNLCTGCGDCEAALPGLLEKSLNGRLPVSPSRVVFGTKERQQIDIATAACRPKALTLEDW